MIVETKNMFRADGTLIQLTDWLIQIGPNKFNWFILDFYGIGQAPDDLSMDEFEETIRQSPTGIEMTWEELIRFSEGLGQTIDCLIIATDTGVCLPEKKISQDDFSLCRVVVQAFDSSEWKVSRKKI